MSHLLLTRSRPFASRFLLRRGIFRQFALGPFTMTLALFVLIVGMGLLYLTHFNQVATKGYELKRLEVERQKLIEADEIANLKLSEARALSTLEQSAIVARMVPLQKPIYWKSDTELAQR